MFGTVERSGPWADELKRVVRLRDRIVICIGRHRSVGLIDETIGNSFRGLKLGRFVHVERIRYLQLVHEIEVPFTSNARRNPAQDVAPSIGHASVFSDERERIVRRHKILSSECFCSSQNLNRPARKRIWAAAVVAVRPVASLIIVTIVRTVSRRRPGPAVAIVYGGSGVRPAVPVAHGNEPMSGWLGAKRRINRPPWIHRFLRDVRRISDIHV
jgi:hypothetical protein